MFDLQNFFTSFIGQAIIVIGIILIFSLFFLITPEKKLTVKTISISALLTALSFILSYVVLFHAPQGGSVTLCSMLPIILIGYFFNTKIAILSGIVLGFLNLLINPYVIHPVQLLLDYPLAFGALGIGGIFTNSKIKPLIISTWVGILGRYFCAVLSGAIFFSSFAPEGFNGITWSLLYNGSYLAIDGILITIVLLIPNVEKTINNLKKSIL